MSCPEFITKDEFERRLRECCNPQQPPPDLSGYCTTSECAEIRRVAENALSIANQALSLINAHTGQPVPGAHQWQGNVNVDVSLASSGGRSLKLFTRVDVAGKSGNDSETISIANLKGDKGDKGDRGEKGARGDRGIDGRNGTNGRDGKNGKDGITRTIFVPDTQTRKRIEEIEKVNEQCCEQIINHVTRVFNTVRNEGEVTRRVIENNSNFIVRLLESLQSNPEILKLLNTIQIQLTLAIKAIDSLRNNNPCNLDKILPILTDIQNRLKALDFKINSIITTLTGIVAAIVAGIVAAIKGLKLEINPEFNLKIDKLIGELSFKLDSLIGKIELTLKPVIDITNKIDIAIKGIELTIKGIDFSVGNIKLDITGLKLKLDSLFKLINNFKLEIDFEPVLRISNSINLKLDSLLKLVNNLKIDVDFEPVFKLSNQINLKLDSLLKLVNNIDFEFEVDFSPVVNIANRIETKINAQLQLIAQLQITIQAVLTFLATLEIKLLAQLNIAIQAIASLKIELIAQLKIALQAILSLRAFLQAQLQIIINSNKKIEDAVKLEISPAIGDCVLIEEENTQGQIEKRKEYQIVRTDKYTTIGSAFSGLYNRFNSLQEDICQIEQKESETDCLVLLPDPKLFYDAGKFLVFSWVLESNPKVIVYQTHTQLRNPIPALQVTPDPDTDYWSIYFADIYRIMGKQWSMYWATDSQQEPLIKGWFLSEFEAIRFFNSMLPLTTSSPRNENNPQFRRVDRDAMQIEYTGDKLILKRVCYAEKDANTDKLKKLHGWGNPNL